MPGRPTVLATVGFVINPEIKVMCIFQLLLLKILMAVYVLGVSVYILQSAFPFLPKKEAWNFNSDSLEGVFEKLF